jgi:hypothetical protein
MEPINYIYLGLVIGGLIVYFIVKQAVKNSKGK